ncbi:unnamed protein product [Eruca vesicaria subsp. sativa]|uniref:Uncharacterized protein n=1 Tax=Eruca vesicaria subsp. sativa TaxID=29727 RepID=A0ABC8ITD4_ERUVS|nr:unnamed protein product [Eruca vesicaria subsp. sativa]
MCTKGMTTQLQNRFDPLLIIPKTGQHFSLHSGSSASTRFIHQVCLTKYEQVDSLGNEAMLFDLGITVLAERNSIYYKTTCHEKNTTQICLFNFETKEMEPLHKFDCSSHEQLARSLWFLPSFKQT